MTLTLTCLTTFWCEYGLHCAQLFYHLIKLFLLQNYRGISNFQILRLISTRSLCPPDIYPVKRRNPQIYPSKRNNPSSPSVTPMVSNITFFQPSKLELKFFVSCIDSNSSENIMGALQCRNIEIYFPQPS